MPYIPKEHEKYITEYFNGPVFIKNWPKDIKAFFMKQNEDGKTVAAVDLEVPGAGELIGGSQREDNLEILQNKIKDLKMDEKDYWWYLDLRKYGSEAKIKEAGKYRMEGKDYIVQDGDVIFFKFNV